MWKPAVMQGNGEGFEGFSHNRVHNTSSWSRSHQPAAFLGDAQPRRLWHMVVDHNEIHVAACGIYRGLDGWSQATSVQPPWESPGSRRPFNETSWLSSSASKCRELISSTQRRLQPSDHLTPRSM